MSLNQGSLIVKSTEKKEKLRRVLTIPLSRSSKQKRREDVDAYLIIFSLIR
jgi:hypothetical protein